MLASLVFHKAQHYQIDGIPGAIRPLFYTDIREGINSREDWPYSGAIGGPPRRNSYVIRKIEGLNPTEANVSIVGNRSEARVTSTQLGSRQITITFGFNPSSGESIRELRYELYNHFVPGDWVKIEFFNSKTKPVYAEGVVESHESNTFSNEPLSQIVIVCPDPYLKALNDVVITGPSGVADPPLSITIPSNSLCVGGTPSEITLEMVLPSTSYTNLTSVAMGLGPGGTSLYTQSNYPHPRVAVQKPNMGMSGNPPFYLSTKYGERGVKLRNIDVYTYVHSPTWFTVNRYTGKLWFGIYRSSGTLPINSSKLTIHSRFAGL